MTVSNFVSTYRIVKLAAMFVARSLEGPVPQTQFIEMVKEFLKREEGFEPDTETVKLAIYELEKRGVLREVNYGGIWVIEPA